MWRRRIGRRSGVVLRRAAATWLALAALAAASACSRGVKADFPRPPATAQAPPPESEPPPVVPVEPVSVEVVEPPQPEEMPEPVAEEPEAPEPAPAPAPAPEEVGPEADPASPQLAGSDVSDPEVVTKLRRTDSLLASVSRRRLSQGQRAQVSAARGFVVQAQRALDVGDERRALTLIDKGLILAEDVERTSRP